VAELTSHQPLSDAVRKYSILASFGSAEPKWAGEVTLVAGQRVKLLCNRDFKTCSP